MPQSMVPEFGGPIDYVESLMQHVPIGKRAKILAQYAMMKQTEVIEHVPDIIREFKQDNDAGVIQPPLPEHLANEINFVVVGLDNGMRSPYPAAFLAAWAMSEIS